MVGCSVAVLGTARIAVDFGCSVYDRALEVPISVPTAGDSLCAVLGADSYEGRLVSASVSFARFGPGGCQSQWLAQTIYYQKWRKVPVVCSLRSAEHHQLAWSLGSQHAAAAAAASVAVAVAVVVDEHHHYGYLLEHLAVAQSTRGGCGYYYAGKDSSVPISHEAPHSYLLQRLLLHAAMG